MNIFKQGMKGPARPAPAVPGMAVNRYSPVTNWNDDPFGTDVFEPTPQFGQKRKPPPRPPPPKMFKQPDIPAKPTHFIRRPTVLSALLSRKSKDTKTLPQSITNPNLQAEYKNDADPTKIFPKCDAKNIQTGTLIDFASPPSSPTFTTRSSSDGLSVDSFGSDATTSTNHHNAFNGGSTSQAESGFEDDFDLFLNTRKVMSKEDTLSDFSAADPFSPQPKPSVLQKPVLSRDLYEISSVKSQVQLKGPTIIRAKPARPRPPDSVAILKSTFGNSLPPTMMSLNTTAPIQKVNGFNDVFEGNNLEWDRVSPEIEASPPMPSIPPPPPPMEVCELAETELPLAWPEDQQPGDDGPYAIALYDYFTGHHDDLAFSTNERINLIRRVNDEWLYGSVNGSEGLFPSNYVDIKLQIPSDTGYPNSNLTNMSTQFGTAIALYDFVPDQSGDLGMSVGDQIKIIDKLNDEWYFGECNGAQGQFPVNYVQIK